MYFNKQPEPVAKANFSCILLFLKNNKKNTSKIVTLTVLEQIGVSIFKFI